MENHWRYCQPPPMSGRSRLLCPVYDWIRLFSFRLHLASVEWRQNPIRFPVNLMLEFCIASEGLTPAAKPARRSRPPFDGFPSKGGRERLAGLAAGVSPSEAIQNSSIKFTGNRMGFCRHSTEAR